MEKIDANTLFGFWPKRNIDASVKALLSRMDKAGVDKALTCSIRGFLYDFREGNEETRRVCKESKGRLIPVATINPSTYFDVMEEVGRIVKRGFRMVRFFPTEQEWTISQRHFTKLLEKLADTDLVLMIPSTEGITAIANVTRGMPNAVVLETVRAYPHLAELIVVAQENPRLFIETHSIGGMDFVEVLVGEVGEERLVYGSGAPLHCFAAAALPIVNAGVSESAKAKIFSGNIRGLLGLR